MLKNAIRLLSAFTLFGLVSGAALGGCNNGLIADACDQICICDQCTEADRRSCQEDAEEAQAQAEAIGCSDQFDGALSCINDNLSCQSSSAANKACKLELKAFDACSKGGGIFGISDDCTRATSRLEQCLNLTSQSGSDQEVECSGTTLCSAQCINAADCQAIKDAFSGMPTEASKSFLDCATKCASAN